MLKILEGLVDPKVLSILKTLLKQPNKLFHLNSLAKSSKVPVSSTARIIKRLVKNNFAKEIKIGKISVYKLAENKKVSKIKLWKIKRS